MLYGASVDHSAILINKKESKMAKKVAESKVSKWIDVPFWNEKGKLNEGDTISGYYVDREDYTTKFGDTSCYILKTEEGHVKLAGQADIRNKFDQVPQGAKVWVTYDGLTETKRGAKKSYTVEYDDEDILATEE